MARPRAKAMIDNRSWYLQGRSDQRARDWPVIAACLCALVLFIVFGDHP